MAYHWTDGVDAAGRPTFVLTLRPNRPLTARGFVWFFGITAGLTALPLLAVIGSAVMWMLLPFAALTFAGAWTAIRAHARGPVTQEVLTLTQDRIHLLHHPAKGASLSWEGNPYWLRLDIHPDTGPVPDYLTLTTGGRTVELGAFLAPEERISLKADLETRLAALRRA